jgi:hypothetical protein
MAPEARSRGSLAALSLAAALILAARAVRAEEPPGADPRPPNAPYTDPAHPHVVDPHDARDSPLDATPMGADPMRHWQLNPVRPFVQATAEIGFIYARPSLAVGYGRPHYQWAGVELLPQIAPGFAGLYVGARAAFPWLEVRAGARFVRPLFRPQLEPRASHDLRDLERDEGTVDPYVTYELEALPELRLGPGYAVGTFTALAIRGFSPDRHVFEENLRVIVARPVVLRARAGYLFDVKPLARARLGAAAEIIHVPGRDMVVVRAGLMGLWRLHEQIDVVAHLLPVIASPDRLGLLGADFWQLGVRYRWATPDIPGPDEE